LRLVPDYLPAKGYRFQVTIPAGHPVVGVILSDQVKSLSWQTRGAAFAGDAPAAALDEARGKIKALLQFR
jgi:mRNA interferase MazF